MTSTVALALAAPAHWAGPGPWWPIFPILWFLFVLGCVVTFGMFGRRRWHYVHRYAGRRAGEARLAERYAGGEIDEQEYERRLSTLRRMSRPGPQDGPPTYVS
jgi:putative membrane protein